MRNGYKGYKESAEWLEKKYPETAPPKDTQSLISEELGCGVHKVVVKEVRHDVVIFEKQGGNTWVEEIRRGTHPFEENATWRITISYTGDIGVVTKAYNKFQVVDPGTSEVLETYPSLKLAEQAIIKNGYTVRKRELTEAEEV